MHTNRKQWFVPGRAEWMNKAKWSLEASAGLDVAPALKAQRLLRPAAAAKFMLMFQKHSSVRPQ